MSGMLPQRLVTTLRKFTNVAVDVYGMPCTLYVPSNMDTVDASDVYAKPGDFTYTAYETKVWVEWSPNKHRLRKLGLFVEDENPMIAWFSNVVLDKFGAETELDICIHSYFVLPTQYIPGNATETEEFELVDVLVPSMADKLVRKCFKIAARRIKTA